jgi:hypothetical protein
VNPNTVRLFFELLLIHVWLTVLHEELDIVFGGTGGHVGRPATVLTIRMSATASSSLTVAVNTPNPTPAETADSDNPAAERGATRRIVGSHNETDQPTAVTTPLSRAGDPPAAICAPVEPILDSRTNISHTLDHAEEAMDTVKTWKSTVNVIKWVMDTIGPIADVCPILFLLALPS